MFKQLIVFVGSLLFLANTSHSQSPSFVGDSLDNYIKQGIKDWEIPGLSVVIVKDGKVAFMKGYGVRDVTTMQPVNENTLFMIASNTKLFTGTALALLDYRKKISLNDRVTKYLPDFRLYDSAATALVTIRDMLGHRIGTKTFQGDFTFLDSKLTRKQIMSRMKLMPPSATFRQDFGYCNSCFMTAGEIIPKVTGQPWEVFIYDSIIAPLGMKNTLTSTKGIDQLPNIATPYTSSFAKTLVKLPYDQWDNLGPAASIVSSVNDLSHWLLFQLGEGRYEGKNILPANAVLRTRRMNLLISEQTPKGMPTQYTGYGLGLFITTYKGAQTYWHTGGALGMLSSVCFVPEKGLGIAILTNNDNQDFFEQLRYQILDAYLNVPYVNRSITALADFKKENKEVLDQIDVLRSRIKGTPPPLPLSAYAGNYENKLYGSISIEATASSLKIAFENHPNLSATLNYMNNDEWLIQYNISEYGVFPTKFITEGNKVKSVSIKVNDFIEYDPYIFSKY